MNEKKDPRVIRVLLLLAVAEAALFVSVGCVLWFRSH